MVAGYGEFDRLLLLRCPPGDDNDDDDPPSNPPPRCGVKDGDLALKEDPTAVMFSSKVLWWILRKSR